MSQHPQTPDALPDSPGDPLHRIPLRDLLIAVVVGMGASRVVVMVSQWLFGPSGGDAGAVDVPSVMWLVVAALGGHSLALIGSVYWFAIRRAGLSFGELGLRPIERQWWLRAALFAVVAYVLVVVVNVVVQTVVLDEPIANPQLAALAPAGLSWSVMLVLLVLAGVVAPFAEELFFRGLLYGWLRQRMGVVLAGGVSALCFSVLHVVYWLIPALFVLGVVLAIVYQRSGSLWAVTITHSLFNSVTIILLYLVLAFGLPV